MNGIKVTGGNVQLSSDKKTLTLKLQLDGVDPAGGGQGRQGGQGGQGGQGSQGGGGGSQPGGIANDDDDDNDDGDDTFGNHQLVFVFVFLALVSDHSNKCLHFLLDRI